MKDKSEMLNGDGGYGYEGREDENRTKERRLTPFERLSNDLSNDQKCLKEITLGKRIGFYRIRGELGSGNFSQVKMGIHALTKGIYCFYMNYLWYFLDDQEKKFTSEKARNIDYKSCLSITNMGVVIYMIDSLSSENLSKGYWDCATAWSLNVI